jgi:hypothetical protein
MVATIGGPLRLVIDQPGVEEELAGAPAGGFGQRAMRGFVVGCQFAGSGAACRLLGGAGFLGGGFGEPGRHRLARFGGGCPDSFLDLGGDGGRQLPHGHA